MIREKKRTWSSDSIRSLPALAPASEISRALPVAKAAGTAEQGISPLWSRRAGYMVKMVHNGIEYGMMAAYAEA